MYMLGICFAYHTCNTHHTNTCAFVLSVFVVAVRDGGVFFFFCALAASRSLSFVQHSPQLQYTPPQSPYTHSPRGVWGEPASSTPTPTSTATAVAVATATTVSASASSPTATGVVADANSNDQRWGSGGGTGVGMVAGGAGNGNGNGTGTGTGQGNAGFSNSTSAATAAAVTRVGGVGSPGSVAGAVAVSAAAAASAAASAASAAAAAGVADGGRAATTAPTTAAAGAAGAGPAAVNDKLVQLKKEKRVLHVMLKNFEKEFKEMNGREVRGRVGSVVRWFGGCFGGCLKVGLGVSVVHTHECYCFYLLLKSTDGPCQAHRGGGGGGEGA